MKKWVLAAIVACFVALFFSLDLHHTLTIEGLKSSLGHDIEFNFEESINLQGNSGPYFQYL